MEFKNKLRIIGVSFENGLFHFITEKKVEIPSIIKYSKHCDRHFIFYNCKVIKETERKFLNQFLKLEKNYHYDVEYEFKFTDKDFDNTKIKFYSYIRNQKLNLILDDNS